MFSVLRSCLVSLVLSVGALTPALAQDSWTQQDVQANPSSWREVDASNLVLMNTTKGDIVIELATDFAPGHVTRVREILKAGYWDGTQFHRVISGFMAQGGDTSNVHGEIGLAPIPGEFVFRRDPVSLPLTKLTNDYSDDSHFAGYVNGFPVATEQEAAAVYTKDGKVYGWMPHCAGIVSMARTNDPNSATDQFFLMREETPSLDRKYTSWGRMIHGAEVARAFNVGEPPERPDLVVTARLVADLPRALRPRAYVMRNDSAEFKSLIADSQDAATICKAPATPAVVIFP